MSAREKKTFVNLVIKANKRISFLLPNVIVDPSVYLSMTSYYYSERKEMCWPN
jgi:hypothetical protein